jgi:hypothetical protein
VGLGQLAVEHVGASEGVHRRGWMGNLDVSSQLCDSRQNSWLRYLKRNKENINISCRKRGGRLTRRSSAGGYLHAEQVAFLYFPSPKSHVRMRDIEHGGDLTVWARV